MKYARRGGKKMNYSIIIPMRNAEKYISECIKSIVAQTYTNFEVIIVDDCSQDQCVNYANQILSCSKIKYKILINCEQKGVSFSRNRGIKEAVGKYIFFIDADDYIEPQLIEKLNESMKYFDYVYCNYDRVTGKEENRSIDVKNAVPCQCLTKDYIINRGKVWGASLKRSTIIAHNIRFDEELDYKEDHLFIAEYMLYISNIGIITTAAYHYRVTPGSLVQNNGNFNISANKSIAVFSKAVDKLKKCETSYEKAIFVSVCRLFLNAAWMEWYKTGFSSLVNYEQLIFAQKKFILKYVVKSSLSFKEKCKEIFMHFPLFRNKLIWSVLLKLKQNI